MRCFLQILIFSIVLHCTGSAQIVFDLPLHGTAGQDYIIGYYVAHADGAGIRDAYCGSKTYDGHKGTDFMLKNFRAMDSGVYVYAAADGIVARIQDGLFDRNKHWKQGGFGNFIRLLHDGKLYSIYGHLKRGSLIVKEGDTVRRGQAIAKVGSSGYSAYPHLHFEVRTKLDELIDPFSGDCENEVRCCWSEQPPYDTRVFAIDHGFVPYIPNYDTMLEGYLVKDTFLIDQDTTVCFWVQIHGLRKGDQIRVEWYTPVGSLWSEYEYRWNYNWWYDYTWPSIKMPPIRGRWNVKLFVNNNVKASRSFLVIRRN